MISIGKEVRQAEQKEKERQDLLGFYLSALQLSAKHALDTPGRSTYVAELRRLCEGLSRDSSPALLRRSLEDFERCLAEYCTSLERSLGEGLSGNAREIRAVLGLLKEAAGTLESSNERIGTEVNEFTHELEQTLDCQDLSTIRDQLSDQVRRMKDWGDALRSESAVQLVALERQLRTYEDRLRDLESSAATDPLTGVWNRREADRRLQESVDRGAPFSLIVLDLNKFKAVNDQYGHRCGDKILRQVAERLRASVRPRDRVCRWGGDEFIVLMDLEPAVGERRRADLADQLHGTSSFEFDGQQLRIEICASVGWAAFEPGDSVASLFQRADLDMYEKKRQAELNPPKTAAFAF
jgi:diguanylate cyclase (GGDEF)-like protein